MRNKKLLLPLTVLLGLMPLCAFADPGPKELVQRVQQNYGKILSLEGIFTRTFTARGMKTQVMSVKYSYKTGRQMLRQLKSDDYDKADGAYEYHVNRKLSTKRPVVADDLYYLPYTGLVVMAPTVIDSYDLTMEGSETVGSEKAWLVKGVNRTQKNSNIHVVWKIGDGSGAVVEVDVFDGGNHLAQVATVNYSKVKGVYIPIQVSEDYRGKILHSQFIYNYSNSLMDTSLGQDQIAENPTSTPSSSPTAITGLVQNVLAAPNVSKGGEPVHIHFTLGNSATVRLGIFTISGEQVYSTTESGTRGVNVLTWDVQNKARQAVATGLYIYALQVDDGNSHQTLHGKILILH